MYYTQNMVLVKMCILSKIIVGKINEILVEKIWDKRGWKSADCLCDSNVVGVSVITFIRI